MSLLGEVGAKMNDVVSDHAKSDPASNAGAEHMRSLNLKAEQAPFRITVAQTKGLGNSPFLSVAPET